jgi:hypothetical protein
MTISEKPDAVGKTSPVLSKRGFDAATKVNHER